MNKRTIISLAVGSTPLPLILWLASFGFIAGYLSLLLFFVFLIALKTARPVKYLSLFFVLLITTNLLLLPNSLKTYETKRISYFEKITSGEGLRFNEKINVYGLHVVMSALGALVYPEASQEALLLHLKQKDGVRYFKNDFFLNSTSVQSAIENGESLVRWDASAYQFGGTEARYALALNPGYLKAGEAIGSYEIRVRIEYPATSETVLMQKPLRVVIEEGLFHYLQTINWLHPYDAVWTNE